MVAVLAAALRDYTKARPRALVVLVNHGRANADLILDTVPARLRDRARVIELLHTGND
jgi:hypothetical protein